MQTYIALLRGINVSGQKKIKMADLRKSLERLSFSDITTYIQSGNIIFKSNNQSITALENLIYNVILKDFGFDVPVMIKTSHEIKEVLDNNPFEKESTKDPKLFYVVFLKNSPATEDIAHLRTYDYHPEAYVLNQNIIYFYAANGAGNAKMNNNFFEKKLKIQATTRNWKTTQKLYTLTQ